MQAVGIFGTENRPSYADGQVDDSQPVNTKLLTYEVFGSTGTVADISYFDVNAQPQEVQGARLPWSLKIATNSPAIGGTVVAKAIATASAAGSSWMARSRPREFRTK